MADAGQHITAADGPTHGLTEQEAMVQLLMMLRNRGITDQRVLTAIEAIPRHHFVSAAFMPQAYEDTALPIDCGQTISQPYVVALMSSHLDVQKNHMALEVGTGSGYQAAVLSRLCRRLYTVERHKPLLDEAVKRFEALRLANIHTRYGDGAMGWEAQAPFDRIMVTAAAYDVPQQLADQLAEDGKMLVPVGEEGDQMIVKVTRTAQGFESEDLMPVRFVPLVEGVA